jgi:hypothetical protein
MTVLTECFVNDAGATTLSGNGGSITSGATSFVVASGSGLSASLITGGQLRVRIGSEIIIISSISGNTLTVATGGRGAEGTSAASHNDSDTVTPVLTKAALERWASAYVIQPRHHKMLAWAYEPALATTASGAGVTQAMYLTKVYIPENMTVANLLAYVATAGSGLTSANAAVYDGSGQQTGGGAGVRIATTATQTSLWTSGGLKTMALTADAGASLNWIGGPDVWVYLAVWSVGTTQPAWLRTAALSMIENSGLVAADGFRFARLTGQATLPTSITISTLSTQNLGPFWMGVS